MISYLGIPMMGVRYLLINSAFILLIWFMLVEIAAVPGVDLGLEGG